MKFHKLAVASLIAGLCGNAWGSGFALSGKSVSSLGQAFSGTAVVAEDATVVYTNPAAMRSLTGEHLSAILHFIPADVQFDNEGSTTSGNNHEQIDKIHLIPNFYYVNTLNDELSFGLGIYSPFGLGLEYDDDWVGRYHTTNSELRTINISPAIAFSPSDKLNLGFGVDFQYAKAELSKAVDFGTICAVYESRGLVASGTCADPAVDLQPQQDDGGNTLTGSNWAVGYSLGLTYDYSKATRFGLSLHSATRHNVSGTSEFDGVPAIFAGTFHDSDASLSLMLPENLSIGMRHRLSPRMEVLADYTWMRWSRYDELVVKFTNGLTPVAEEHNWRDAPRYSLGMNYRWQDGWLMRAGISYDQTPIPDAEHRSPKVPDADKLSLGLGSKVELTDRLNLDMGILYTLKSNADINNTDNLGHTLKGSYAVQTTYLSVQLNWQL